MENAEEIMQSLEEFSKMKPKDIPHELDDYLGYVAKTGDPVFKWSITKCLFREKLLSVITDFYESTLSIELPPCPNVDPFNYERMKANLLEKLDSFHGAPFTVQRISELLTNPRKEYNRADKFMRAIEKNILVVSTREPGRIAEGECEADPSFNGVPDDSGVETVFPCNDIADQRYEVTAETVDPGYHVGYNVNAATTAPSLSTTENPARDAFATATSSESDEPQNIPSTSQENAETSSSKETESVICSNVTSPPAASSEASTDSEGGEAATVTPEEPVEVVDQKPMADVETESLITSTLETAPEVKVVPLAEVEEAASQNSSEPSSSEGDSSSLSSPEAAATTTPTAPVLSPGVPVPAATASVPASSSEVETPTQEPAETPQPESEPEPESTVEETPSQEEKPLKTASSVEIAQETVDKEVAELQCSEAALFEEECPEPVVSGSNDSNTEPTSTLKEESWVEGEKTETIDEQREVSSVASEEPPAAAAAPVENEVASTADSTNEPMDETEVAAAGDQSREESVIHTTSSEEPMEVEESLPSTEPPPEP